MTFKITFRFLQQRIVHVTQDKDLLQHVSLRFVWETLTCLLIMSHQIQPRIKLRKLGHIRGFRELDFTMISQVSLAFREEVEKVVDIASLLE